MIISFGYINIAMLLDCLPKILHCVFYNCKCCINAKESVIPFKQMNDHHSNLLNLSSRENKAWKKLFISSPPTGILQTHNWPAPSWLDSSVG